MSVLPEPGGTVTVSEVGLEDVMVAGVIDDGEVPKATVVFDK